MSATAMGSINVFIYGAFGLALWFGSKLIADQVCLYFNCHQDVLLFVAYYYVFDFSLHRRFAQTINPATDKPYTGADIVSVFFAVLMGSFAIGQAAPSFPAFAKAKGWLSLVSHPTCMG